MIQGRWPIVLFGFMALSLAFSARAALGLIMPVWQSELGWSAAFVSGVGATALIVMAVVAPFAGMLVDRQGPRLVLAAGLALVALGTGIVATTSDPLVFALAFAGLGGAGFGIVAVHTVATAVAYVFSRGRGLATGIATSGSTGGQFLVVPLVAFLLTVASWRWSFGGLAVASAVGVVCVLLFLPRKSDATGPQPAGDMASPDEASKTSLLTSPVFLILFFSFALCGFTTAGVIETHLLPFASFCGFPPLPSATAYGLLSAVNLAGMIGAGWLSDRVDRVLLLAGIYGLRALTFILLANLPGMGIEWLFAFAVMFGAVDYATVPVTASLVASHLGLTRMGTAMGLISAGHAGGAAAGAFAGGALFDAFGNYDFVWTTSLVLAILAGILVLLMERDGSGVTRMETA